MTALHRIEIRHNFETAHRLAGRDAPVKCRSIHGHSWWVTVTLAGPALDRRGMLVEFGAFKKAWRGFLDDTLDHHLVLEDGDPLIAAIRSVDPAHRVRVLPRTPTTEVLAAWLFERAEEILGGLDDVAEGVRIEHVHVQETRVNAAGYGHR